MADTQVVFFISACHSMMEVLPSFCLCGSIAHRVQTGWRRWTIKGQPNVRAGVRSKKSVTWSDFFMGENPWIWKNTVSCQLYLYWVEKKQFRRGRTRLITHWNLSVCDIHQSHISECIVGVVKTAYLPSNEDLPEKGHRTLVRALPVSWAYKCHIVLEVALSVAFWWSSGIFQKCYTCTWHHLDQSSLLNMCTDVSPLFPPPCLHCCKYTDL